MSDQSAIVRMLQIAETPDQFRGVQSIAAQKLLAYDSEVYPRDGCAITLSVLIQKAGVQIRDTFGAWNLGRLLHDGRSWQLIDIGKQQPGDVGSTCTKDANHGQDHIYLVVEVLGPNEMIVADNQNPQPHKRSVKADSRRNYSPTTFFLRAV